MLALPCALASSLQLYTAMVTSTTHRRYSLVMLSPCVHVHVHVQVQVYVHMHTHAC